ncbi:MAG: HU family DNA-binding protein [Acidobacteria bacterium]|nr:HU family DNA-binding protein [Acidobacteriota bacterium]
MTKAQVCRHMAGHFAARATGARPLTRDDAREFLDELRRLCVRELADTGRFSIPKVAKLVVETRRPRRGRDPVSGTTVVIPARRIVRARVSAVVRDAVEDHPKGRSAGVSAATGAARSTRQGD